jgi:serine O-acetyltransferase
MKLSLTKQNLITYTSSQLNNLFPDNSLINLNNYAHLVDLALDRVDYCFKKVTYKHYFDGTDSLLNHLHADQYLMYVWFLSNTIAENSDNISLANKLYYLNKTLHGFDCMYNTKLPNIFVMPDTLAVPRTVKVSTTLLVLTPNLKLVKSMKASG